MYKQIITFLFVVFSLFVQAQTDTAGSDENKWKQQLEDNYELYVRKVKYQKENTPWVDIHFGLNNWLRGDYSFSQNIDKADVFRSWAWKFGLGYKKRFDKKPFVLQYGLQVSVHRIGLTDDNMLQKTGTETFIGTDSMLDVERSRFVVGYLNSPLMFHLDLSPYGIDKGFTLGLGGEVGVRVNGYQQQYIIDEVGDKMRIKTSGNYNFSRFRYGLAAQLGYKKTKISLGYDLNPVFQDGPQNHFVYCLIGLVF
jgi:hypothetical protein